MVAILRVELRLRPGRSLRSPANGGAYRATNNLDLEGERRLLVLSLDGRQFLDLFGIHVVLLSHDEGASRAIESAVFMPTDIRSTGARSCPWIPFADLESCVVAIRRDRA